MSWIKINNENDLPEEGIYVIAKHNRDTWIDSTDQKNVNTVIVKMTKGISEKDRQKMRDGNLPNPKVFFGSNSDLRSNIYQFGDEFGNNLVNYEWKTFGNGKFFGQTITYWMPIPNIE